MSRRFSYLAAAICFFLATGAGAARQAHNFTEQQCQQCHLSDPSGGEPFFIADVDTLCKDCHTLLESNVHPSLVAPGMAMPPGFWLDAEGRLNCATCHDPHPDQGDDSPFMLRSSARDLDFCALCHDPTVPHQGAAFVAHSKTYSSPQGDAADLDRVTRDCLTCHDPSDPHASVCLIGQQGQCAGHIIGVEYDGAAAGNQGLKPRSGLSPFISLYEGKIGSASCHSIYSGETTMLVFSNKGSALCLGCHKK